jgi:Domain of unknown function (DUF4442)
MTLITHTPNRLQRQLSRLNEVPAYFRPWFQSVVLGRAVPFTGTAKLRYEVMSHAVATTLAAETATGMVMGMNVRDDCLPVVKEMRVQFPKRGMGAMRAVATLTNEQRALIQSTDKGEVTVPVVVTDESGNHPLVCEFIWAWIPSKRPAKNTTNLQDSPETSA